MIGYLTGKIISKKPTQLLLDVSGVGYLVNISVNTFENLSDNGENASLYIHTSVKEDSIDLYGFFTNGEKEMFEILIGVNGVGPKLAQSILSGIQIDELKDAITNGNISRIIAVPGIGRKTAERLLVELRDKVSNLEEEAEDMSGAYKVKQDAVSALVNLGYNHKTSEKTIRNLLNTKPDANIEELIKEALNLLNN
jgi:Holliday junction DNA helicase RuvA